MLCTIVGSYWGIKYELGQLTDFPTYTRSQSLSGPATTTAEFVIFVSQAVS
jgi:hypothetical protein